MGSGLESGYYVPAVCPGYLFRYCFGGFLMPAVNITPSYQTALACMRMIRHSHVIERCEPLALKLLAAPNLWLAADRQTVRNAFDTVLFDCLDKLGLPRFTLPVEFVAAGVVMFVHPANFFTMCLWSESHGTTADEMAQDRPDFDVFNARQLFAVVTNVYAYSNSIGPGTFENAVDIKVRDALAPIQEPTMDEYDGNPA